MTFPNVRTFPQRVVDVFTISDDARDFAAANRPLWIDIAGEEDGILLADVTLHHPGYVMNAGILGNMLADELGLGLSFLVRRYDREIGHILCSYGPRELFSLKARYRNPLLLATAVTDTNTLYQGLESIEDLLGLSYGGIHIGDLVYNTYLTRKDVGTMESLSADVLPVLFETVFYHQYYEHLFETRNIRAILAGQISYSETGVLLRLGSKHDLDVFERIFGPKQLTIRRFCELPETGHRSMQPAPDTFEHIWAAYRDHATEEAERYFENRLKGEDEDVIVSKAYGEGKSSIDKAALASELEIDPDKPMVVIMTHVFLDAGHFPGGIFRDYVTWLRETLQYARNHREANWIVKKHPGSERFDCLHTVGEEVRTATEGFENHTIRLLPDDISTQAVHDIADAVLTVRGSAGIEFPALGTPAITASQNHYTGFGFTREPDSKQEYFDLLDQIEDLPDITDKEQGRAKVMAYIIFILMRVPSGHVPEMPKIAIDDTDDIWRQGAKLLSENQFSDKLLWNRIEAFIENDYRHLLRYEEIGL